MPQPRDVVVVRVSHQGDREDEHFHSPEVQAEAAKRYAKQRRERIIAPPFREIDVSGKLPLARRPGLLAAIELVEAGKADHILVAYFDRLVRSLKVQLEVIERVEKAGGEIFALDHGKLTNGTAATRLSTNMMGAVFQYFAEVTGEKVTAGQARAVAHGIYPHPKCPPGLRRRPDGVLEPDPKLAPVVVEAFKRRDGGATLGEVQALLAEHGVERGIGGVHKILSSRLYLGELHFGELHNLKAHKPVIKDRGPVRAGAAPAGAARPAGQLRAAARAARGAALRRVRVADGDEQLERQLSVRQHELARVRAEGGDQGRPGRADRHGPGARASRRRPRPRLPRAADPRGGRADRAGAGHA
jgi:DNA invertase Pin-like site-specific DNA recombinase